jgi:hypothetical protein
VEETLHQIDVCGQYLNEYRSHLARMKTESEYDAAKSESLPDDTDKVISNWKMKILACYFRENQGKLFGKRGISLLGFMIVTNSKEEEERQKDLKDVQFVFMVSDDTLQDECGQSCVPRQTSTQTILVSISRRCGSQQIVLDAFQAS